MRDQHDNESPSDAQLLWAAVAKGGIEIRPHRGSRQRGWSFATGRGPDRRLFKTSHAALAAAITSLQAELAPTEPLERAFRTHRTAITIVTPHSCVADAWSVTDFLVKNPSPTWAIALPFSYSVIDAALRACYPLQFSHDTIQVELAITRHSLSSGSSLYRLDMARRDPNNAQPFFAAAFLTLRSIQAEITKVVVEIPTRHTEEMANIFVDTVVNTLTLNFFYDFLTEQELYANNQAPAAPACIPARRRPGRPLSPGLDWAAEQFANGQSWNTIFARIRDIDPGLADNPESIRKGVQRRLRRARQIK